MGLLLIIAQAALRLLTDVALIYINANIEVLNRIMNKKTAARKPRETQAKIRRINKLLNSMTLSDIADATWDEFEDAERYLNRAAQFKKTQMEIQFHETTQDESSDQ